MAKRVITNKVEAADYMAKIMLSRLGVENELTPEEREEMEEALEAWMDLHPEDRDIYENLYEQKYRTEQLDIYQEAEINAPADFKLLLKNRLHVSPRRNTRPIWLWSAAASILILITTYSLLRHAASSQSAGGIGAIAQDLQPGGSKAVLTLGNGNTVILDSAHQNTVLQQGSIQVTNHPGGVLSYRVHGAEIANNPESKAVVYNTLSTGRGGQYELQLPDGTHVWLDAATTLRYPTVFNGARREVELEGQAYFEVAHRREAFIVHTKGKTDIQDLGTAFNIRSYPDENFAATVLQGSARVSTARSSEVLRPGQQVGRRGDELVRVNDVDTSNIVAWKNGQFSFDGADITSILREVSRWYDVDVTDHSHITQHFVMMVPRNVPVSVLMRALERTNKLHYHIQGKNLVIEP